MEFLTILEWVGTITGVICVYLAARAHILSWPVGIVSVTVYAFFFWHIKLYADSALQVFYIGTGIYGWWHWLHGGPDHGKAAIQVLRGRTRFAILAGCTVATAVTGYFLSTRTDASFPYWDAFTTAFSIAAQLLLMRKVFENWILWIAVDIVAIGVYFFKEAYVTSGLYAIFLGLATWGLLTWRAKLKAEAQPA